MDKFARSANLAYFKSKDKPLTDKWTRIRKVGKDTLSLSAQLRLEWIIFYHTSGKENASSAATYFGISRKTFHKWLGRFEERNLKTLEEESKAPKKSRDWMVTFKEEERIIFLRKKNMEFGKKKLKTIYQRDYGETISTWKIERVVRRHNPYPDKVKHRYQVEKRSKGKPKIRISEIRDSLREIKEECGKDVDFTFKKILYIRDYIKPEEDEHSIEFYILGDINRFEEVEGVVDEEFAGLHHQTWVDLDNLPENILPKGLTATLKDDYKNGFPRQGEYLGVIEDGQALAYLSYWLTEGERQIDSSFSLHAAALSIEDRGILLLGDRGAGKTSTLLSLAKKYDH